MGTVFALRFSLTDWLAQKYRNFILYELYRLVEFQQNGWPGLSASVIRKRNSVTAYFPRPFSDELVSKNTRGYFPRISTILPRFIKISLVLSISHLWENSIGLNSKSAKNSQTIAVRGGRISTFRERISIVLKIIHNCHNYLYVVFYNFLRYRGKIFLPRRDLDPHLLAFAALVWTIQTTATRYLSLHFRLS